MFSWPIQLPVRTYAHISSPKDLDCVFYTMLIDLIPIVTVLPFISCALVIISTKLLPHISVQNYPTPPFATNCFKSSDPKFRSFGPFWVELCRMGVRHTKIPSVLHGCIPSFSSKIKTMFFLWYILAEPGVFRVPSFPSGICGLLHGLYICFYPKIMQDWSQWLTRTSWK